MLDPAHMKTPYLDENSKKRTYISSAARIGSGAVFMKNIESYPFDIANYHRTLAWCALQCNPATMVLCNVLDNG